MSTWRAEDVAGYGLLMSDDEAGSSSRPRSNGTAGEP
jgi:hypothetical protein